MPTNMSGAAPGVRRLKVWQKAHLQIISGCVCHLEQLRAQSPFLFPIVLSINLIPFFDICSVLAVLSPGLFGLCSFTWAAARSQLLLFVVLAGGLVFHCGLPRKSPLFPGSPLGDQTDVCSSIQDRRLFTIQCSPRIIKHVVQLCRSSQSAAVTWQTVQVERRTSPFNGIERSFSRAMVIKTKSLPISATTFPTALSLYIAEDGRKHKHNPTLSAKKHVVQICRSSLSAAADGLADGSGER